MFGIAGKTFIDRTFTPGGATLVKATTKQMMDITDNGSLFVAVGAYDSGAGNCEIYTSSNGSTWTRRSNPGGVDLFSVTFGNSIFVAVGNDAGSNGLILSSTNGTTWTQRTAGDAIFDRVIWEPTSALFYAVGTDQTSSEAMLATSSNGTTWTKRSIPGTNVFTRAYDVYYGDSGATDPLICLGVHSSVGDTARYIYDADGISWSGPATPSSGSNNRLQAGVYDAVNSNHWILGDDDLVRHANSSGFLGTGTVIMDEVMPFLGSRSRLILNDEGSTRRLAFVTSDGKFHHSTDFVNFTSLDVSSVVPNLHGVHYGFDGNYYVVGGDIFGAADGDIARIT